MAICVIILAISMAICVNILAISMACGIRGEVDLNFVSWVKIAKESESQCE